MSSPRTTRKATGSTVAFLGPFLVLFALFYVGPIGYSIYQSVFALRRSSSFGEPVSEFVGLENYGAVLDDPEFRSSVANIAAYGIGPSLTLVLVAIAVSLLIDEMGATRVALFGRLATFLPFAVPAVIGTTIWGFLYSESISPILRPMARLGLEFDPFASPVWAVGNIAIWAYAGFNILILLSALASLDRSLLEAARVDGANAWRVAWHIKLPHLRASIVLSVVFNLIGTIQLFTEPTVLRAISPAISSAWTPTMLAFSEAAGGRTSYAATIAVVLAVGTGVLSFTLMSIAERRGHA